MLTEELAEIARTLGRTDPLSMEHFALVETKVASLSYAEFGIYRSTAEEDISLAISACEDVISTMSEDATAPLATVSLLFVEILPRRPTVAPAIAAHLDRFLATQPPDSAIQEVQWRMLLETWSEALEQGWLIRRIQTMKRRALATNRIGPEVDRALRSAASHSQKKAPFLVSRIAFVGP